MVHLCTVYSWNVFFWGSQYIKKRNLDRSDVLIIDYSILSKRTLCIWSTSKVICSQQRTNANILKGNSSVATASTSCNQAALSATSVSKRLYVLYESIVFLFNLPLSSLCLYFTILPSLNHFCENIWTIFFPFALCWIFSLYHQTQNKDIYFSKQMFWG